MKRNNCPVVQIIFLEGGSRYLWLLFQIVSLFIEHMSRTYEIQDMDQRGLCFSGTVLFCNNTCIWIDICYSHFLCIL